jgi:orotate phosphoribosyltransferase
MSIVEQGNPLLTAYKSKLAQVVIENVLQIGANGSLFTLNSGLKSPFYYDFRPELLNPRTTELIGKIIWEEIKQDNVDSVGGLATGAINIAIETARASLGSPKPTRAFYTLKEPNERGSFVEGNLRYGDNVLIVDDTTTTGKSMFETIEKIKGYDCTVVKAMCILDREQGAAEAFQKLGIPYVPILQHSDFAELIED